MTTTVMQILYVLCGVPASGKTTLSKSLAKKYNANIHSYDDIPNSRGNADLDGGFQKMYFDGIRNDLENGYNVICDNTNLTVEHRTTLLKEFADICCEKVLIFVDTNKEECLRRNAGRVGIERVPDFDIQITARFIETPTYKEGWDKIYVYSK